MCGRFAILSEQKELVEYFLIDDIRVNLLPNYNACLTQHIPAIISAKGKRRLGALRWGLIPYFAQDESIGYKTMNARSETVELKSSFRHALQRQRCIIPANGYYEWKPDDKQKQPYFIRRKDKNLIGFAGLWDQWVSPQGEKIASCTILTAEAQGKLAEIHHRMPIVLGKDNRDGWLNTAITEIPSVKQLLAPNEVELFECFPVSKEVNKVKNNFPELIEPYTPNEQLSLL